MSVPGTITVHLLFLYIVIVIIIGMYLMYVKGSIFKTLFLPRVGNIVSVFKSFGNWAFLSALFHSIKFSIQFNRYSESVFQFSGIA